MLNMALIGILIFIIFALLVVIALAFYDAKNRQETVDIYSAKLEDYAIDLANKENQIIDLKKANQELVVKLSVLADSVANGDANLVDVKPEAKPETKPVAKKTTTAKKTTQKKPTQSKAGGSK